MKSKQPNSQTAKQPNSQTAKQPNSQTAKQPNSHIAQAKAKAKAKAKAQIMHATNSIAAYAGLISEKCTFDAQVSHLTPNPFPQVPFWLSL